MENDNIDKLFKIVLASVNESTGENRGFCHCMTMILGEQLGKEFRELSIDFDNYIYDNDISLYYLDKGEVKRTALSELRKMVEKFISIHPEIEYFLKNVK